MDDEFLIKKIARKAEEEGLKLALVGVVRETITQLLESKRNKNFMSRKQLVVDSIGNKVLLNVTDMLAESICKEIVMETAKEIVIKRQVKLWLNSKIDEVVHENMKYDSAWGVSNTVIEQVIGKILPGITQECCEEAEESTKLLQEKAVRKALLEGVVVEILMKNAASLERKVRFVQGMKSALSGEVFFNLMQNMEKKKTIKREASVKESKTNFTPSKKEDISAETLLGIAVHG
eukprot:TRINITY_DN1884_c0_g1_i19.p3 TRINITY_DN1884_c0_g1~~TRINITY_DN1884_c0_g1_i19.p3  ORF type:complete len:234 (+),score=68.59 TRINITY_DN1884_c0_g1_i19:2127-2828(+)